jgi:hypothetical protein
LVPRVQGNLIHAEHPYIDWIVKLVRFHCLHSRKGLFPPETKSEAFLTHLAVNKNVAPATGQRYGISAASQSSALHLVSRK